MLPHDPSKISPIFSKAFMRDAYSYSEDSGPKPDSNPKQESCHQIKDVARKFKMETSLHGLKYIAESDRHILERLFWVIVVLMSWCTAGYLIYVLLSKFFQSPVLVTFDSMPVVISEIPFPGVTICNMNKVRKSRVENIAVMLRAYPSKMEYLMEKEFVKEVCGEEVEEELAGHHESHDLNLTGKLLHKYMADLSHSCDDMLLNCFFEGHERHCFEMFTSFITDEGQCCSFNIMPEALMFNNDETKIPVDEFEEKRWSFWNSHDGYLPGYHPFEYGVDDEHLEHMPRRSLAPGLHMGLTVVLDTQEEEYYCSGSQSVGFKALIHPATEIPELVEFGFAISPGTESFISVDPEMIHADEAIHKFSVDKRQCYLEGEKPLTYFREYSFLNCFLECSTNYTFMDCGCVAYYMPRNPDIMPICAPEKLHCVEHALTTVEETAFSDHGSKDSGGHGEGHGGGGHGSSSVGNCKCLPSCTEVKFPHETSTSSVKRAKFVHIPDKLRAIYPEKYENDSYVQENLAVMHIYFENLHFMRRERGELYGFIDFFSNIGGVLGLCMGFSMLSFVEAVYFFTLRFLCNKTMKRNEDFN